MKTSSTFLAACLAFTAIASGSPTTSSHKVTTTVSTKKSTVSVKTSTVSTKHSTATPTPSSVAKSFDINFDERTVIPALPLLNPVGMEDNILFNSFVLNNPLTGIIPHSKPNVIVTAAEQQQITGTPYLTILYPGSTLKSIDLHSFYYGCALNSVEGAAAVAEQCSSITVAGFRGGKEVALASFAFSPSIVNDAAAPMIQAVLPKNFVGLENITFIQDNPAVEALNLDDISVTTHT